MIAAIVAVTRLDTPEGLSVQSVPVLPLAWVFVELHDHYRLRASLGFITYPGCLLTLYSSFHFEVSRLQHLNFKSLPSIRAQMCFVIFLNEI